MTARARVVLVILLLTAACGPGALPRFANPPPEPDAGEDDAGTVDASDG